MKKTQKPDEVFLGYFSTAEYNNFKCCTKRTGEIVNVKPLTEDHPVPNFTEVFVSIHSYDLWVSNIQHEFICFEPHWEKVLKSLIQFRKDNGLPLIWHPEQQLDEVYLGNVYGFTGWKTSRRGRIPYCYYGSVLKESYPSFAKIKEIWEYIKTTYKDSVPDVLLGYNPKKNLEKLLIYGRSDLEKFGIPDISEKFVPFNES